MVLDGLFEALHLLLRGQLESRALLDNLETVMLAVDELASVRCIQNINSSLSLWCRSTVGLYWRQMPSPSPIE
jgi:hypothetical protein